MTHEEFAIISEDLRKLAANIPLHWGSIQNNRSDSKLNMFTIHSYEELEVQIASLDDSDKNYFRRRWYLWQCSKCDEYLFCCNKKASPNPNPYDKLYDVEFHNNSTLRFDIKGTVVPRDMRSEIEQLIKNPQPMIDFYYSKQSTGVRAGMQNRLFIVHHSFIDEKREFYLRCAWGSKSEIYDKYANLITNKTSFFEYNGCKSDVIFILEKERQKVESITY